MRVVKIIVIGMMVSAFLVGQAYSAPKENKGKKGQNVEKTNNNSQVDKGKSNSGQVKGKSALNKQRGRRANEAKRQREARDAERNLNNDNNGLALRADKSQGKKEKNLPRALGLIDSLSRARWSHNPHDTRGQGNMGKPDMLDPFGHDKDSNRKELYGNNGRPIRVDEEPPTEPPPEPILDASIDFSSIESMQWLVDWYNSVLDSYYENESVQALYTYDQWQTMWYDHFFPGGDLNTATGIRLNTAGKNSKPWGCSRWRWA